MSTNKETTSSADVEALITEFQRSGMRELHLRAGGIELYLSADGDAPGIGTSGNVSAHPPGNTPLAPSIAPAPVAIIPSEPATHPEGAIIVRAPYLGTFYRSPKPGAPVYVETGTHVTAETELCLVEVMKLFTAVRASVAGVIHAVLAVDGQMVAADQPLFVIRPA